MVRKSDSEALLRLQKQEDCCSNTSMHYCVQCEARDLQKREDYARNSQSILATDRPLHR